MSEETWNPHSRRTKTSIESSYSVLQHDNTRCPLLKNVVAVEAHLSRTPRSAVSRIFSRLDSGSIVVYHGHGKSHGHVNPCGHVLRFAWPLQTIILELR